MKHLLLVLLVSIVCGTSFDFVRRNNSILLTLPNDTTYCFPTAVPWLERDLADNPGGIVLLYHPVASDSAPCKGAQVVTGYYFFHPVDNDNSCQRRDRC